MAMRDKIWVREQFLSAIDVRIAELDLHYAANVGIEFPEKELMVNQRNRVAVFLGESKHRYTVKNATALAKSQTRRMK
jgi:hypothetical protein